MFGLFSSKKTEESIQLVQQALDPNVVAIVSASCCMSGVGALDEQLKSVAAQALKEANLNWPVLFVTVTEAQGALSKLSGKLSDAAAATAAQVSELFVSSGLGAFPVLIVNQRVVSYGGVPELDLVLKNLPKAHKAVTHENAA